MAGSLTIVPTFCPITNTNLLMSTVSIVHAEIKTYTGTGRYIMSDFENQNIAQQRAIDRAIKNAKQQAGVYLQSYSRLINGNLTNDEIFTITNNIVEVLETNCVPQPFEQDGEAGLMYTATVRVNIDTDGVRAWINRDAQDKSTLINQNNAARQTSDANDRQVEDLRKRAQNVTTNAERAEIRAAYQQADNEFLANQKLEEGNQLYYKGDYNGAIAKYNEALTLYPNGGGIYHNRGAAYDALKKYELAIADSTKAIELNPNEASYYYNRGYIYSDLQSYTT